MFRFSRRCSAATMPFSMLISFTLRNGNNSYVFIPVKNFFIDQSLDTSKNVAYVFVGLTQIEPTVSVD